MHVLTYFANGWESDEELEDVELRSGEGDGDTFGDGDAGTCGGDAHTWFWLFDREFKFKALCKFGDLAFNMGFCDADRNSCVCA